MHRFLLNSLFFKLVQCQPQLNHQTQPFLVKGIWLVPNNQTLAGFGIGALRSVTIGVFWFRATLLGWLKQILTDQKLLPSNCPVDQLRLIRGLKLVWRGSMTQFERNNFWSVGIRFSGPSSSVAQNHKKTHTVTIQHKEWPKKPKLFKF